MCIFKIEKSLVYSTDRVQKKGLMVHLQDQITFSLLIHHNKIKFTSHQSCLLLITSLNIQELHKEQSQLNMRNMPHQFKNQSMRSLGTKELHNKFHMSNPSITLNHNTHNINQNTQSTSIYHKCHQISNRCLRNKFNNHNISLRKRKLLKLRSQLKKWKSQVLKSQRLQQSKNPLPNLKL